MGLGKKDMPPGIEMDVVHFDLDVWPHPKFVSGDAHFLPFTDQSFASVFMGDIHEHLVDPLQATLEAARVCRRLLVITIFEEWRLPGHGQYVQEGQIACECETSKVTGYANYALKCAADNPEVKLFDDQRIPHHAHINQFDDGDIAQLVGAVKLVGFQTELFLKAEEATYQGHVWSNWLIAMSRKANMKTFTVHIGLVGQFKNARLKWVEVTADSWQAAKKQVEDTLDSAQRVVEVGEGVFPRDVSVWEVDK